MSSIIESLAYKYRTPAQVQKLLRQIPYNTCKEGGTLYSAEQAVIQNKAHCFEAAFLAAAILEHHGYLPLVLSIESQDHLDHVVYIYRENNNWGSIGRSRDEGLHGRAPMFKTLRQLTWSYYEPYVDLSGKITGYQWEHLDNTGMNWRQSPKSIWGAERHLNELKHEPLSSSEGRYQQLLRDYKKRGPVLKGTHWR